MPTKAELEAELAELKAELEQAAESGGGKLRETASGAARGLGDMFKSAGLDSETLESLGPQALEDLSRVQRDHPLAMLIAAFALGFVAGRASK